MAVTRLPKILAAAGMGLCATLAICLGNARHPTSDSADYRYGGESEMNAAPRDTSQVLPATPLDSARIVINKSTRRLTVYSGDKIIRTYKIALGREPKGDKVNEGDGRTPEGEFYVCNRNAESKYYRGLGLSYPNKEAAARGLTDGLISRTQHEQIVRAIDEQASPPWDTPIGGEIFIHGGGATRDWTMGCVALENEDIRELFDMIPVGTPVRIEP
jgi:lipoprotein-anchoring transpeptidase ErfK/SrfK